MATRYKWWRYSVEVVDDTNRPTYKVRATFHGMQQGGVISGGSWTSNPRYGYKSLRVNTLENGDPQVVPNGEKKPIMWTGPKDGYYSSGYAPTGDTYKRYGTTSDGRYIEAPRGGKGWKIVETGYEKKEVKGSYQDSITDTSRRKYPDNGVSGGYWYVYQGIDNRPPSISGSNLNLGSKTDNFSIEYIVSDKDGDRCTVDILVDGAKKVSNKTVTLGSKYTYAVDLSEFTLGKHTIQVIAKDSHGETATRTYTFSKANTAPEISGQDEHLGGKSTAFTIDYSVTDKNNDDVAVTVLLDDLEIQTVSSAQDTDLSVTITTEQLDKMAINSSHVITIKADDGKGGIAYRRYEFIKLNRVPIISGTDEDLGEQKTAVSVTYSITDVEGDEITHNVYLNEAKVIDEAVVIDNEENTYTIPKETWIRLPYETHTITIEAWDTENINKPVRRVYTFQRVSNGLDVEILINSFDELSPKKIIAMTKGAFAEDSTLKVFTCNNYFDEKKSWEEMTSESSSGLAYAILNEAKTAGKWGLAVKITCKNGESGMSSVLKGLMGGYE